jgi:hypothetical protein
MKAKNIVDEEKERIQIARYQKIDEELYYDRENQSAGADDEEKNENKMQGRMIPDIENKPNEYSFLKIGFLFLFGLFLIGWFLKSPMTPSSSSPSSSSSSFDETNTNQNIPSLPQQNEFDEQGRYVMKNYDYQKPMSSFLPGLGGVWGVPMWAFYVNRGQGITAFGVDNKDGAIAKYNSAEKAYQQTPFTGFRTFLKGSIGGVKWEHMPFFPSHEMMMMSSNSRTSSSGSGSNECTTQREMRIGMNELEINEIETMKQIETNILYFTLPEEEFPGLVRRVKLTNLNTEVNDYLSLEILDGLTRLEPAGIPNGNLDSMGRTMEAWMNVYNIHQGGGGGGIDSTQPFFHISQGTADAAQVQIIKFGHFAIGYLEGIYYSNGTKAPMPRDYPSDDEDTSTSRTSSSSSSSLKDQATGPRPTGAGAEDEEKDSYDLLPFIVDPSLVFDTDTSLMYPKNFFSSSSSPSPHEGVSIDELFSLPQGTTSRTPCAYTGASLLIPPGGYMILTSIYGHANSLEEFLQLHSPKLQKKNYIEEKLTSARDLVEEITSRVETNTSSVIFNKYIQQNFLDNILRGGLPLQLGIINTNLNTTLSSNDIKKLITSSSTSSTSTSSSTSGGGVSSKIYHVYSRIHGDLERDYNFFNIDTTYFSQGPGNFRDINQNRRIDVQHSPFIFDYNIKTFLSFIQTDGYNPLTVASPLFILSSTSYEIIFPYLKIIDSTSADGTTSGGTGGDSTSSGHQKKIELKEIVTKPFRVGQLLKDMKIKNIQSQLNGNDFINLIISVSRQSYAAQYAQNGFWTDHWTYTLDLIQSFLTIFPDYEEQMMYGEDDTTSTSGNGNIPFYMSPAIVKPRSQRYVLISNPSGGTVPKSTPGGPRQSVRVYNAVVAWGEKGFPQQRLDAMMRIFQDPNYVGGADGAGGVWQRCRNGHTTTTSTTSSGATSTTSSGATSTTGTSILTVTPITKLSMLAILKFSTLDPYGMGIEMEGGKPGWNDAMNGLPGLIGSEMSETYEMLQILRYLKSLLIKYPQHSISFPIHFYSFIQQLQFSLIQFYQQATATTTTTSHHTSTATDTSSRVGAGEDTSGAHETNDDENIFWSEELEFQHWNNSNNAREMYRETMISEPSCHTHLMTSRELLDFILLLEKKTMNGIQRALQMNHRIHGPGDSTGDSTGEGGSGEEGRNGKGSGVSPTYFYYDLIDYDTTTHWDNLTNTFQTIILPKKFSINTLPLFLEGAVRHMKTIQGQDEGQGEGEGQGQLQELYSNIKRSDLYDRQLQMFKISSSLKEMSQEIGRMVAFSSGWLENESIWLHMSYKFYLELLRGKLYDAFYLEITTGLVPFMNSNKFGRSPLEAASFIVSSVFPDEKLHGAGFLARLSGSTAEFLSMWIILTQGHQPFALSSSPEEAGAGEGGAGEGKELTLTLSPILAKWFFHEDGTASFTFLGKIPVTYHNPLMLDTWNLKPIRYEIVMMTKRKEGKGKGQGRQEEEELIVVESQAIPMEYALRIRNLEAKRIDVFLG